MPELYVDWTGWRGGEKGAWGRRGIGVWVAFSGEELSFKERER